MSPKLRMRTPPHRGGGGRGGGGAVTSDSYRQGWWVGAPHFLRAGRCWDQEKGRESSRVLGLWGWGRVAGRRQGGK